VAPLKAVVTIAKSLTMMDDKFNQEDAGIPKSLDRTR